ncbi:hypothetical protein ACI8AC_02375 [Geodermatophilus sp. SYSU D00758]
MAATVSLNAAVRVEGGPTLALGASLQPETYTMSTVSIDGNQSADVALLPDAGTVILLGLRARHVSGEQAGKSATVTVTPKNGDESGTGISVAGALVVANAGVLAALVENGPRALTIANAGAEPVVVDILACLDQP